jgi:hypothetical protein
MQTSKRVETHKLIAFIKLINKDNNKVNYITEPKQEFTTINNRAKDNTFKCLNQKDKKITTDLPPKLRSYYDPFIKEFVRSGSLKAQILNENVSFYYSVLSACIPKFVDYTEQEQIDYIKCLREKLVAYISNTEIFKINSYDKMKWNKKSIIQSLMQFKVTKPILKLLADYFSINIFILNILEDKLYLVSGNGYYDMFRYNIFVTLNNITFETLSYLNEKMLKYNNVLVKKIISIHKNILLLIDINLNEDHDPSNPVEFSIKLDELNYSLPSKEKANTYNEITESESNLTKETDIESKIPEEKSLAQPVTGVVFNVSLKMKLDALQDMATKLNIELNKPTSNGKTKAKTKNELVDEINIIMLK